MMKTCTKCGQAKSESEYYKDKNGVGGLRANCKTCSKAYSTTKKYQNYQRMYRVAMKEYFREYSNVYTRSAHGKEVKRRNSERYPERMKARATIRELIRKGKIKRAKEFTCSYCPNPAAEYHHHNGHTLEHKLDVIPLCIKCHRKVDAKKYLYSRENSV